ncbi:MAG TPA: hypothetical protein VN976_02005 [Verrucomicrobiae bacterium]|nr:hypothetical protein [Verrucomicrobiae bacterium]
MSSGVQVDLDWAGTQASQSGAPVSPAGAANTGAAGAAYLTDEEILDMEPIGSSVARPNSVIPSEARNLSSIEDGSNESSQRDSSGKDGPQNDNQDTAAGHEASAQMPSWMATLAADPKHGGEAQQLWREHQEFRAAFASPEEARAIKELLPGGVRDVLTLREATQSVDRIDAAIFSGDARAQSEVVAELARANPAAFRSMFAEAAKVLAGMGQKAEVGGSRLEIGNPDASAARELSAGQDADQVTRGTGHEPRATALEPPHFDPSAYANFERATNDAVARDVRGSIGETLARVMPEGVAEGAARRIGEDIFNEVHRALAADRALSEQVAGVLRDRRFGGAEQQRVASLLAGRAKQLVPSVARRVIGEWTSTVLNTARSKAARQAAAAARVDIAAPGGSLDSMPLRQMSPREVNYASMSDEEILGI